MSLRRTSWCLLALSIVTTAALVVTAAPTDDAASEAHPVADLRSAGALTFGPDGTLFVADAKGAAVFAFDVAEATPKDMPTTESATDDKPEPLRVTELDEKIAAALGTNVRDLVIGDMAVHPRSRSVYLSVHRGRGDDAIPVLSRVSGDGTLTILDIDALRFTKASLNNAPAEDAKDRRGRSLRQNSVTDLKFHGGKLYVAGLSNEEFASTLRVLSYPFGSESATSLEVFHGAHGQFETHAPIRRLLPLEIDGASHIVAGYTCTPLVTFPAAAVVDGEHVKGKTVAELGFGNTPLDMLSVTKGDKTWVLVVNSRRSGMKIDVTDILKADAITTNVEEMTAGTPFIALPFGGIQRLAELDDDHLVALRRNGDDGSLSLSAMSKRWI